MAPTAPAPMGRVRRAGGGGPPLRAAVIGAGAVAKQHLACLSTLAGVTTVGVCDLSPAVAESAAERFGIDAWFTDSAAMLDAVRADVVHVTTPPQTHLRLAREALAAGAHVIVEKPLAADTSEVDALLAEAEDARRILVEDYSYLCSPQVLELEELRRSGRFGRLVHVDIDISLDIVSPGSVFTDENVAHPALALPGGAVADFLPHLASLAVRLIGPPRAVRALWEKRDSHTRLESDDLRALVAGEGASADLSFSGTSQPDGLWLRAHGTRMRFEANLFEPRMTVDRLRDVPRPLLPVLNGAAEARAVAFGAARGLWGKLAGGPGGYAGLWELVRRTYDSIALGSEPPVSAGEIRAVNALIAQLVDDRNAI